MILAQTHLYHDSYKVVTFELYHFRHVKKSFLIYVCMYVYVCMPVCIYLNINLLSP